MRIGLVTDKGATVSLHGGAYPRIGMDAGVRVEKYPDYQGPYEVTPSEAAQVLHMAGTSVESDVTVNPIPSNYGLVTWNGSVLTVS